MLIFFDVLYQKKERRFHILFNACNARAVLNTQRSESKMAAAHHLASCRIWYNGPSTSKKKKVAIKNDRKTKPAASKT